MLRNQPAALTRPAVVAFNAAASKAFFISSSATGIFCRQFGCSSMVPGMLGCGTTPSRSSSEIASSRERVRDEEADDGIHIVLLDRIVPQHLIEHRQRMPAFLVGLAGVDAEPALGVQIAERAPARIGREIVGAEGDQRIGRIIVDVAETPRLVALEHHHLVGPDAPIGHLLAEALRHRAEILADDDTIDWRTFQRGRGQAARRTASGHTHPGVQESRAAPDRAASTRARDRA